MKIKLTLTNGSEYKCSIRYLVEEFAGHLANIQEDYLNVMVKVGMEEHLESNTPNLIDALENMSIMADNDFILVIFLITKQHV